MTCFGNFNRISTTEYIFVNSSNPEQIFKFLSANAFYIWPTWKKNSVIFVDEYDSIKKIKITSIRRKYKLYKNGLILVWDRVSLFFLKTYVLSFRFWPNTKTKKCVRNKLEHTLINGELLNLNTVYQTVFVYFSKKKTLQNLGWESITSSRNRLFHS